MIRLVRPDPKCWTDSPWFCLRPLLEDGSLPKPHSGVFTWQAVRFMRREAGRVEVRHGKPDSFLIAISLRNLVDRQNLIYSDAVVDIGGCNVKTLLGGHGVVALDSQRP